MLEPSRAPRRRVALHRQQILRAPRNPMQRPAIIPRGNLRIGLLRLRQRPLLGERNNEMQLCVVPFEPVYIHLRQRQRSNLAKLQQRSQFVNRRKGQILDSRWCIGNAYRLDRVDRILLQHCAAHLQALFGDNDLLSFRSLPRVKHIRRRHIVGQLQRPNLRIPVALVAQPVEHQLLLLRRKRPHTRQLRRPVQHLRRNLRQPRRLRIGTRLLRLAGERQQNPRQQR